MRFDRYRSSYGGDRTSMAAWQENARSADPGLFRRPRLTPGRIGGKLFQSHTI
jgi:hypothetical protein